MAKKPNFKELANRAAKRNDQTQTATGGGDFTPPPAGKTVGRLVEYIELGMQKSGSYKGKEKAPAPKVRLVFELLGNNYVREVERDGKKVEVADRISLRPMTLSLHEKATFKKLFNKMLYGRQDINHMSQMLGEAFRIEVVHNVVGEGDKKKTYANIQNDDGWLIGAPVREELDEDGNVIGTKKLKVREAISQERMFIWDEPTQETWDSLFIDGEREVKDEKGKTRTVSNNWLQNTITSALNFEGSPIQAFLEGSEELPDDPEELEDDEVEEDEELEEADDESEEDTEDEEEDTEEEEEVEDEEVEEEEVQEAPKKITAKKQLAAKKAEAKAPAKKSAPAKAASTKTAKTGAKSATKSPSKTKKAAEDGDQAMRELGLID